MNTLPVISNFGMSGVTYKNFYFKDVDDLRKWFKDHSSSPCHGLFLDLNSFLEHFAKLFYVDLNKTMSDLYMSNKIGYTTQSDAIVAGSFQNVLPAPYGRNPESTTSTDNANLEAQPELPGLQSFSKWDRRDGSSGRRYWLHKEARNTHTQVDGMIRHQLEGPAQILAKELLTDSYTTMSDSLVQFISQTYDDTMHSGRFDSDQAWKMTCKFVKRIFIEISDARVIARDGIHTDDPWTTSARFLFATLKAHEVMSSFMKLGIKDHPSISSEMVKFICYSQPSTDTAEVMTRLTNIESLQRGDQSQISRMDTKVQKLTTWKNETEKSLKRLLDKNG